MFFFNCVKKVYETPERIKEILEESQMENPDLCNPNFSNREVVEDEESKQIR